MTNKQVRALIVALTGLGFFLSGSIVGLHRLSDINLLQLIICGVFLFWGLSLLRDARQLLTD